MRQRNVDPSKPLTGAAKRAAHMAQKGSDSSPSEALALALKHALAAKDFELHEAIFEGRERIDVFEGRALVDALMASPLADPKHAEYCLRERKDAVKKCVQMMRQGYFVGCAIKKHQKRFHAVPPPDGEFRDTAEEQRFYELKFYPTDNTKFYYGAAVVAVGFGVCLFPVWPESARFGVMYGSRYLLAIMAGVFVPLTVIRPIMAGFTGGWFLPDLWGEPPAELGPVDQFMWSFKRKWQPPDAGWPQRRVQSIVSTIVLSILLVLAATYFMYAEVEQLPEQLKDDGSPRTEADNIELAIALTALAKNFSAVDANTDAGISLIELRACGKLSEKDVGAAFRLLDDTKDGLLQAAEIAYESLRKMEGVSSYLQREGAAPNVDNKGAADGWDQGGDEEPADGDEDDAEETGDIMAEIKAVAAAEAAEEAKSNGGK